MPSPANDLFANAEVLSGTSGTTTGDNTGADVDGPYAGSNYRSVWYSFSAPAVTRRGALTITITPTGGSPLPSLYIAIGQGADAASFDSSWHQQFYPLSGASAFTHLFIEPSQTYEVFVMGALVVDEGSFQLDWSYVEDPPPPSNDDWANAITLTNTVSTNLSEPIDVSFATSQAAEDSWYSTNFYGSPFATTWYTFVAPATGKVDLKAIPDAAGLTGIWPDNTPTPVISLFGDGATLAQVLDNMLAFDTLFRYRDPITTYLCSRVVKEVVAGQRYYVAISNDLPEVPSGGLGVNRDYWGPAHLHYRFDPTPSTAAPPVPTPNPGTHNPRVFDFVTHAADFVLPLNAGDDIGPIWLINTYELLNNTAVGQETKGFVQFEDAMGGVLGQACLKKISDNGTTATFALIEKLSGSEWTTTGGFFGSNRIVIDYQNANNSTYHEFNNILGFAHLVGTPDFIQVQVAFNIGLVGGFTNCTKARFGGTVYGAGSTFTILAKLINAYIAFSPYSTDFGPNEDFYSDSVPMPVNPPSSDTALAIDYPFAKSTVSLTQAAGEFAGATWPPAAGPDGHFVSSEQDSGMSSIVTPSGLKFGVTTAAAQADNYQDFLYVPLGGPRNGSYFNSYYDARLMYVPDNVELVYGFICHNQIGTLDGSSFMDWELRFNTWYGGIQLDVRAKSGQPVLQASIPQGNRYQALSSREQPIANNWPYFVKLSYDPADNGGQYSFQYGAWKWELSEDLGSTWTTIIATDPNAPASRQTEGYTFEFNQSGGGQPTDQAWDVTFLSFLSTQGPGGHYHGSLFHRIG